MANFDAYTSFVEEDFKVEIPEIVYQCVYQCEHDKLFDIFINESISNQLHMLKSLIRLNEFKLFERLSHCIDKNMLYTNENIFLVMAITLCEKFVDTTENNRYLLIKFLLEYGADPCTQNNICIKIAAKNNNMQIVKLLVEFGADVKTDNEYPIKCAAFYSDFEMFKYLHQNGANIYDDYGEIIKVVFTSFTTYELTKYLLQNGLDINYNNGIALKKSLLYGQYNTTELLLKSGANINLLGPIDLLNALTTGSYQLVEILVLYGCDFSVINNFVIKNDEKQMTINMLSTLGVDRDKLYAIYMDPMRISYKL